MKKLIITPKLKSFFEDNQTGLLEGSIKIITDPSGNEYLDILSREKVSILTASSGKDILNIHSTENADLIIAELDMPEMNGAEVCEAIRNDDSNRKRKVSFVIVCDNDESAINRCRDSKANTYITRPIKVQELSKDIKKFLNISERKSTRIIFQVFVKGEFMDRFFFGRSENISNSGILLSTDEAIEKGHNITCTFIIGEDLISVDGEVARIIEDAPDRYSYGIQFINIDPFSKSKIDELVGQK